jgi:hypothetical protein
MPKKKLTLADTVAEMAAIQQKAATAKQIMDLDDPVTALVELNEAVDNWRKKGPPDFVLKDPEYMKFIKNSCREISADILVALKETIKALHTKIQQVGLICDPRDLSSIVGELGRQLKVLKELDKENELPESNEELDKELAKMREELGLTDDTVTSGSA